MAETAGLLNRCPYGSREFESHTLRQDGRYRWGGRRALSKSVVCQQWHRGSIPLPSSRLQVSGKRQSQRAVNAPSFGASGVRVSLPAPGVPCDCKEQWSKRNSRGAAARRSDGFGRAPFRWVAACRTAASSRPDIVVVEAGQRSPNRRKRSRVGTASRLVQDSVVVCLVWTMERRWSSFVGLLIVRMGTSSRFKSYHLHQIHLSTESTDFTVGAFCPTCYYPAAKEDIYGLQHPRTA